MKKKIFALVMAVAMLAMMLTGCIQNDIGVKMNKDGTGSISATIGIEKDFYQNLKQMGSDPFEGKTTTEYTYEDTTYVAYTEVKEYSSYEEMEKALLASDIGITPTNDGKVIRLVFPQPTEERRKELVKQVQKSGEDAKVAIRNIRRDANDLCKKMKKDGEMTEDEQKTSEKTIQDLTDKYIKEIDGVTAKKEKEIMQI